MSDERIQQEVLLIAPCEAHVSAVIRILDAERITDWVVLPTSQSRRMGRLDYVPSVTASASEVILAMADHRAVERVLASLRAAERLGNICANCLAYTWPATQLRLGHSAVDLVCDMSVERDTALSAEYDGHRYYFCSAECRDRFLDAPQAYIAKALVR